MLNDPLPYPLSPDRPIFECHRRHRYSRIIADGITFKVASCRQEREDAFRLIHDSYVRNKLIKSNTAGLRVTPYHLLPTTNLFVAYHGQQLVYTMTLIGDDELGIPMEDVFPEAVRRCRESKAASLAEVSCLASKTGYFPRNRMFDVFVRLSGMMVQSAKENGVNKLLIACHPRHARFYQQFLGFQQIAQERHYRALRDSPAVACEHDFAEADAHPYRLYDRVHAAVFHRWELYHQPMLQSDREYFSGVTPLCQEHFPIESFG